MITKNKFFDANNLFASLLNRPTDLDIRNPLNYLELLQDFNDINSNNDSGNFSYLFASQHQSDNSKSDTDSNAKLLSTMTFGDVSGLSTSMLGFLELCRSYPELASKIKITSGYRPGAKTSNGSKSFHASGDAIDIVPASGSFDDLARNLFAHQDIIDYLKVNGFGILDETDSEVMKKTKATGKHFHIGKDTNAKSGPNSLFTKYGIV